MFADDTKVYASVNTDYDVKGMRTDMDRLQVWSKTWLLRFNASKCKVMHMGSSNPSGSYSMSGVVLEDIDQEKDVGVYLTKDCKPEYSKMYQSSSESNGFAQSYKENLQVF